MKFIAVRELRSSTAKLWRRLARDKELVVTSNGKPVAVLTAVTGDNLEQEINAIRRARAMAAVTDIQTHSVEKGLDRLTDEEIEHEISAVRRRRHK